MSLLDESQLSGFPFIDVNYACDRNKRLNNNHSADQVPTVHNFALDLVRP